jgi:hypothetical protein
MSCGVYRVFPSGFTISIYYFNTLYFGRLYYGGFTRGMLDNVKSTMAKSRLATILVEGWERWNSWDLSFFIVSWHVYLAYL